MFNFGKLLHLKILQLFAVVTFCKESFTIPLEFFLLSFPVVNFQKQPFIFLKMQPATFIEQKLEKNCSMYETVF